MRTLAPDLSFRVPLNILDVQTFDGQKTSGANRKPDAQKPRAHDELRPRAGRKSLHPSGQIGNYPGPTEQADPGPGMEPRRAPDREGWAAAIQTGPNHRERT